MATEENTCDKCGGRGYGADGSLCLCRRKRLLADLLPSFLRDCEVNTEFLKKLLQPELRDRFKSTSVMVLGRTLSEYHGLLKAWLAYKVNQGMRSVNFFEIDPSQLADVKYGDKKIGDAVVSVDDLFTADLVSLKLTWCTPNSTYEDLLMSLVTLRSQSGLRTWIWLDPTLQQESKRFGEVFIGHIRTSPEFMKIAREDR